MADRDRWRNAPPTSGAGLRDDGVEGPGHEELRLRRWSGGSGPRPAAGARAYLDQLAAAGDSTQIRPPPAVSVAGAAGFPIDDLAFQTTAFQDPQGAATSRRSGGALTEVTSAPPAPGRMDG